MNKIIDKRAKKGELHFINEHELKKMLRKSGFEQIYFSSTYADQDYLVVASK